MRIVQRRMDFLHKMTLRVSISMRGDMAIARWPYVPDCRIRRTAWEIPGIKWNKIARGWVGYPDAVAALSEAVIKEKLGDVQGSLSVPGDAAFIAARSNALRIYQQNGVSFLVNHAHTGAMLAWDVGVGKTACALVASAHLAEGREADSRATVVICPAVVKNVWKSEAAKWTPHFKVRILSGVIKTDPVLLADADIIVLNYDIAYAWEPYLKPHTLICDEFHMLANERSRRGTAVKKIARRAKNRIGLTATPLNARPKDLWNLLDTLTPGRFGPFLKIADNDDGTVVARGFTGRYCDAHRETKAKDVVVWELRGRSNEEELAFRLRWVMDRKTKVEVMSELPPRTRQVIRVDVHAESRAPRSAWAEGGFDALQRAMALSGAGKVEDTVSLAASRVEEGHSVLVFTHTRSTAKVIYARLSAVLKDDAPHDRRVVLCTGEDSAASRSATIERARAVYERAAGPVVVVATMDSVGVGIDLSFCDIVIFNDLDYLPSKLIQCEGRAHRFGQKKHTHVYYMIGIATADEYVQRRVIERLDLYEKVLGDAGEERDLRMTVDSTIGMSEQDILDDLRSMLLSSEALDDVSQGVFDD